MSKNRSIIAYVVYPPPEEGLPFLSVALNPDGKVSARQFATREAAEEFIRELAKGGYPDSVKH